MLAKAIAKEAGIAFIGVKSATVFSKWVGESDKMVTALFGLAKKIAPCVIFIDEVDTLLRKRSSDSGSTNWGVSMTGAMLSEWDGILTDSKAPVLVLGATNRPLDIDDAFLRRMPFVVEVPVPDRSTRIEIFGAMLRNVPLGSDVDVSALAEVTEGATGSDMRELCRLAAINRMKCIMASSTAAGEEDGAEVTNDEREASPSGDEEKTVAITKQSAPEERPFHMGDFMMAVGKMNGAAAQLEQYSKTVW